jgi:hypothetical protein
VEEKAKQETSLISGIKLGQTNTALSSICFHAGFLLGLFFHTEDGEGTFLRNVD